MTINCEENVGNKLDFFLMKHGFHLRLVLLSRKYFDSLKQYPQIRSSRASSDSG
jgi:hypothetical protein